ncbi:MAG: YbaN family protein [Cellulosilyticaceae bacterium]
MYHLKKWIFIVLGTLALLLGIVGIFLPIIPTTPLVMLSAYFYSQSSDKFHHWLISTSIYKKYAKDFVENKQLSRKRKCILLSFATTMLLFPLIILEPWLKLIIVGLLIYLYYYFIFKIKTIIIQPLEELKC